MSTTTRVRSGRLSAYTREYLPDLHPWLRSLLLAGGLYVALFVVVHTVLAVTTDGVSASDLLLVALVSVPQAVIARRSGADVDRRTTAAVSGVLVLAGAVGLWTMRTSTLDESYAAWFLGAITIDLLGLAGLGALRAAWLTMSVLVLMSAAWAVVLGMPVAQGAGLVVRHVATLLIGTLLVVSLRRSRVSFAAFQALRLRRATEDESARARAAARRIAVEQVLDQAGPTLQAIATGRRFTPEDRKQLLALEGALRDQIRAPMLARGRLRESVAAARRRGINVLLMDEAEHADLAARDAAAAWLAERLDATTAGGFVGRLRDLGDGVRVSAVNDDQGDARSFSAMDATT